MRTNILQIIKDKGGLLFESCGKTFQVTHVHTNVLSLYDGETERLTDIKFLKFGTFYLDKACQLPVLSENNKTQNDRMFDLTLRLFQVCYGSLQLRLGVGSNYHITEILYQSVEAMNRETGQVEVFAMNENFYRCLYHLVGVGNPIPVFPHLGAVAASVKDPDKPRKRGLTEAQEFMSALPMYLYITKHGANAEVYPALDATLNRLNCKGDENEKSNI